MSFRRGLNLLKELKERINYDLDESSNSDISDQNVSIPESPNFDSESLNSESSKEDDQDEERNQEIQTLNDGQVLLVNDRFLRITATKRRQRKIDRFHYTDLIYELNFEVKTGKVFMWQILRQISTILTNLINLIKENHQSNLRQMLFLTIVHSSINE